MYNNIIKLQVEVTGVDIRDILVSNLRGENRTLSAFFERRAAHIADASEHLLPDELPVSDERIGILADVGHAFLTMAAEALPSCDDALPLHRSEIDTACRAILENDAVMFASRVARRLETRQSGLLPPQEVPKAEIRVAYVRNRSSDEAFRSIFSSLSVAPVYVNSFREAAEALDNGDADACLLPSETGSGYRMQAAFLLADEFRLRILLAEDVQDGEGEARFLLLSRHSFCLSEQPRFMTVRFLPRDGAGVGALLRAAERYGLTVHRFYTDVVPSERTTYFLTVTLSPDGDAAAFLTYLYLFSASFQFYGVY